MVVFESGEISKTCQFMVFNDPIPEGNETYDVHLIVLHGDGEVRDPKIAKLTIMANDNGNGVIGFSSVSYI